MIASALLVAAPLSHAGASTPAVVAAPSSGVRPDLVTGIAIIPVNGYGYEEYYFYPGEQGYGSLYFEVQEYGSAPYDLFANVTLTDGTNATRDGVGAPAFHAEVPLSNVSGAYDSWEHAVQYTFPTSLPYGGLWTLSVESPLGGWDNMTIQVVVYYVDLWSNLPYPYVTLPGQTFTLSWQVLADANSALYNQVTNVTLYAGYYATVAGVATFTPFFSGNYWKSLGASPSGSLTLTLPVNSTPDEYVNFVLFGTTISNHNVSGNESTDQYVYVGVPWVREVYLSQTPNACGGYNNDYLSPGVTTFVCIQAVADYLGSYDAVPSGLTVVPRFWNGTAWVTPSGGAPASLTTNNSGYASFTFVPTFPPFSSSYIYGFTNVLNVTTNYTQATSTIGKWYTGYNATFYMSSPASTADVQVNLGQALYAPGATLSATWTLGSTNPTSTGTLTATYWYLEGVQTETTLAWGSIGSTASTGTVSTPFPSGFVGEFELYVYASNATDQFYGYAYGYVAAPSLTINMPAFYSAGATLSVEVSSYGVPSGGDWTIGYDVWGEYESSTGSYQGGGLVATGTVANGSSFSISVPSANPPAYYEVEAWLDSPTQGLVASQTAYSDIVSGYGLLLGIQTTSKYSDGSFQPGETVTFSYSITSYGAVTLPAVFSYYVYLYDTPYSLVLQGNSPSGTFQVTIPSNEPAGVVEVEMELYGTGLNGPTCYDNDYCYGWTLLTVNPTPSALEMYVGGAGTGLTVGWLILLIVIIVVAVIAVVLALRHRRPPTSSSSSTMPPPAPAPSTSAPPEWKEPAPSDANSPPMPTPPPGAQ